MAMPVIWRVLNSLLGCAGLAAAGFVGAGAAVVVLGSALAAGASAEPLLRVARARRACITSGSWVGTSCSLLSTREKKFGRRDGRLAAGTGPSTRVVSGAGLASVPSDSVVVSACSSSCVVTSVGRPARWWRERLAFLLAVPVVYS